MAAEFLGRRVRLGEIPELEGRIVRAVTRYGKQVAWELDRGWLLFQLRMTGLLLWRGGCGPYTRARFLFPEGTVRFDDIRQFGSVRYLDARPDFLGPDPLEITELDFARRLRARRRQIKPLLLDQLFLRGIGNIYGDEALHLAGIKPTVRASRLSTARCGRLLAAIRQILQAAISAGGSSVSDYLDAAGRPGLYQNDHRVYGKAGLPCPACGTTILRLVVAQRGTHVCPRCQRR